MYLLNRQILLVGSEIVWNFWSRLMETMKMSMVHCKYLKICDISTVPLPRLIKPLLELGKVRLGNS